ncbi:MAG: hypothetical protein DM484_09710 [Candidatus Methylumidiphilus alinenensis]|uniref:Virulence factor domain-containing protein n=1 Tax=Candidatus Methylumidiphilus alinenensis TaxID=2202197 RepID=A0A2W4R9H5_9GAMM|nr:MAG: hypothetical protein DM484_09710 [Candidatus Methylumidiphilus alinenensis]
MSEYQIMRWRELPSMVIARSGETQIKVALPARFQEAIDEAAMRLGATGADDYISGWVRDPWVEAIEEPDQLAARITAELEADFSEAKIAAFLDSLQKADD